MKTHYWELCKPHDFANDYEEIARNGVGEYRCAIPRVQCPACSIWGRYGIIWHECPPCLKSCTALFNPTPVSVEEYKRLFRQINDAFRNAGYASSIEPGFKVVPFEASLAEPPSCDFMWPDTITILVSNRIRNAFKQEAVTGIMFHAPAMKRIGRSRPSGHIARPTGGEPEDLVRSVPVGRAEPMKPTCSQMVFTCRSGLTPAALVSPVPCAICGQVKIELREEPYLTASVTPDADCFLLAPGMVFVVNDRVRTILESIGATNVVFRAVPYRTAP